MRKFHLYIKQLIYAFSLSIVYTVCILSQPTTTSLDAEASQQLIKNIFKHIHYLGSDQLQGRATGSEGSRLASEYIAAYLEENGIKPIGSNGYFQTIPMHGAIALSRSSLKVYFANDTIELKMGDHYLLEKTGAQTYIPAPTQMVFVGYGIHAPEFDYNDYQGIDVKNKIVVYFEGEPNSGNPAFFDGKQRSLYSYSEVKHRIAIAKGALGSIIIPHPSAASQHNWKTKYTAFSFEDVSLAYRATSNLGLWINYNAVQLLFRGAKYTFGQLIALESEGRLISFELPNSITFEGSFREREFLARNVAGRIIGSDPELNDQYIIISAHYDHLGIGHAIEGNSIYNGVMDNAIGTAAVIEIARLFRGIQKPARSVLFLLLTGEERGLLGSQYYVDNPLIPLHKTVANLNVDGIASFDEFNAVVGVGSEMSTLGRMLEQFSVSKGIIRLDIPKEFLTYESFARSDQISFAKGGIPSILVMDAINYKNFDYKEGLKLWLDWNQKIYHTPFDDLSQPINSYAVLQHVKFLFEFTNFLAKNKETPEWYPESRYYNIRLQTIAENR
jgi:hypothetical protein